MYPKDVVDRFLDKISPEPNSGCWLWAAYVNRAGYAQMGVGNKSDGSKRKVNAHRVSYELHTGPIPVGLEIDHKCRVRCCVNPDHLEAVTHQENVRRGIAGDVAGARERAKTHCKYGHPFSGENLRPKSGGKGHRRCRECGRIRAAKMRQTR